MTLDVELKHLIANQWVGESGARTTPVHEPTTGTKIDDGPVASAALVDQAAQAAVEAFATWGRTTPQQRGEYLLALADTLASNSERFAQLESRNVGKPIAYAREEMPLLTDLLRYYAGVARVTEGGTAGEYTPGSTSMVRREPIGPIGLITPWNYPVLELVYKVAPALAAGDTIVLKPSELTPCSSVLFAELAAAILPAGVLNIVLGDAETGQAIVDNPALRMISLTGDVSTGKKVAAAASAGLKRVALELGGKAPVLVFDDTDTDATACELAAAGMANSGQDCTAACRVIVHEHIYDAFLAAYVAAIEALKVGPASDSATQVGPLVSRKQRDRAAGFVERAKAAGATVRTGGTVPDVPGFYYPPTVVTDVEQHAEIIQNEVFGPVVTVQKAPDDDRMLALANDVPYGLSASIWTKDLGRTLRFTRALNFGTVWVNQHLTVLAEMPFGGFGASGYGKELSTRSLDDYSRIKHVMIRA
ncbi:aldehyde dehydrogenase family protein [Streptomyces sp. GMR22]|uniref:aldehyde dehydrogenase family protein n=1 Tax=Streptomyces sp. GMR22 TaxID=2759524 RepID=UPI0015FCDB2C|nr:aldehyde dehydrogenase family protein [Streptomyces sp. GMR22]MBA6440775.1 aldehyde dehydrogenase family protein [Streptomyces sp. GMR22]